MRPIAAKYREYLNFVTVDSVEYSGMLPAVGLQGDGSSPGLAVQNPLYGYVYPYTDGKQITPEVVMQFVTDIAEGRITPWSSAKEGSRGEKRSEEVRHNEL